MRLKLILSLAAPLVFCGVASAHHSVERVYYLDREVSLQGTIVRAFIRNPHSFLVIQAPDDQGAMQRWFVESHGFGSLRKQGIQPDTFKAGDDVSITINPGRKSEDHRGYLTALNRTADGFQWAEK